MVIRPKSMATVVVVFWSTPPVSSTDSPASLRSSSVRSGRISLTAPTRVVLPTPNPPATRIFSARAGVGSEGSEAIDHFSQDDLVGQLRGRYGPADDHVAGFEQVPDEDAYDADGQVRVGGEFGDGLGLRAAQGE